MVIGLPNPCIPIVPTQQPEPTVLAKLVQEACTKTFKAMKELKPKRLMRGDGTIYSSVHEHGYRILFDSLFIHGIR